MQPTFSLAYTSCRPASIGPVVNLWRSLAENPNDIEVVIGVDGNNQAAIEASNGVPNATVVVQPEPPFNCVRGWNVSAAATTGKVIIAVSDDFRPPQGWDKLLLGVRPGWEDKDHVLMVDDGYVRNICVIPIITRVRYNKFGYLFYPQYESMFCDTELTTVAQRDGAVIEARHLLFEHQHPDCGKRQRDASDLKHASQERWDRGEMLYNMRKGRNFPLDDGPLAGAQEAPQSVGKVDAGYCAYIQATKDDISLNEVSVRLLEDGINDFFFCIPNEYWSGEPNTRENMQQVLDCCENLKKRGANVRHKIFNVQEYRFPGDSRITVETRVRNDSLAWCREEGFRHICIVDGDELWAPGTLRCIQELVRTRGPYAINLPMIPVVGLPGYPVDRARDRVVSYVGANVQLRDCRTPLCTQHPLNNSFVMHFTGTRRTMDEIVKKHRRSGHYDDPNYDFEGWLRDVLPNIRPGMANVHMYKNYQIWPSIRHWTRREYEQIPESLRNYMAKPPGNAPHMGGRPVEVSGNMHTRTPKVHEKKMSRLESLKGKPDNIYRQ